MSAAKAIDIRGLKKFFITGLRRKRTEALRGLDLAVEQGEIFGFLGPNGAGKTTTIKILVDLIRADEGVALIFGMPSREKLVRQKMAYLPELPNFYDYLSARELLFHLGQLSGIDRRTLRARVPQLLEKVGLDPEDRRSLRKYSKGMQQRVGIAQAMLADPDLYILDEPMTGLDPLGRRWMKELIADLGRQGKTVFFSSHVLAEAEAVCNRVAFIDRGRLVAQGALNELLAATSQHWEIVVQGAAARDDQQLQAVFDRVLETGTDTALFASTGQDLQQLIKLLVEKNYRILSVNRAHGTLEDLFVQLIGGERENPKP